MILGVDPILTAYAQRILPGVLLFALCLVLLPRRAVVPRIALYIGLFVLVRDGMTPAGLWAIDGLRIAFHRDGGVLAMLGLFSVAAVAFLWAVEGQLRPLLVWRRGSLAAGAWIGLGTGLALALPVWIVTGRPAPALGAGVGFLAGLVVLAYGGNLLEEVLFRGYLQAQLATWTGSVRAALLSGLGFAACHSYLALTVTSAGWPILAFTAAEGIACAFVRLHYGIWSAALAHGTAILLISGAMR